MTLMEKLTEDMKTAMKAKEEGKLQLSCIRMIKSQAKYAEIEKGEALNDDDLIKVIAKEVKSRKDVLPEYEAAGRTEQVEQIKKEIEIIMTYLPKQMEAAEITELAKSVIAEVGAVGPKDMGKVMGKMTALTKGKADGKTVSEIVKSLLA